jgi:hypothetical protein
MFVVSLLIVGSHLTGQLVFAQGTTSTYENLAVALKFEYPSEWELRENPKGLTITPEEDITFSLEVDSLYRLLILNPNLKEFAHKQYLLCAAQCPMPLMITRQLLATIILLCNMNILLKDKGLGRNW